MTKPKEWEAHHALIWRHDNHKFLKPTSRGRESPVIERFDKNDSDLGYYIATISIVCIIAVVAVLAVVKVFA